MNFAKHVFHPCDITNKTPKSFTKSEEMQHDNLKAPKLKLTQEAETLPSTAQLIALTAPFRRRQLVTCLSHHIRSTRTLSSRLFDPYFSEFMRQYSYHPWCAIYPWVTLLTTSGGGEAGDVKISLKREIPLQVVNHIARVKCIKFDLYLKQV